MVLSHNLDCPGFLDVMILWPGNATTADICHTVVQHTHKLTRCKLPSTNLLAAPSIVQRTARTVQMPDVDSNEDAKQPPSLLMRQQHLRVICPQIPSGQASAPATALSQTP